MKIIDVITESFTYSCKIVADDFGHIHPGPEHIKTQTLVRIITDQGVEGHAFGGNPETINKFLKPALVGENPLYRELLWVKLRDKMRIFKDILIYDIAVIDLGLWDLAGKIANQPVFKLIGAYDNKVKAYASTMCGDAFEGGLDTPESYARFALECKERGYDAFKMHLWVPPYPNSPNWKKDLAACKAVRKAVGQDMTLMVDLCGTYNRQNAFLLGKQLEKLDFYWIEEPFDEASISSYEWLAKQLDMFVIGPETPREIETRAEWIVRQAADIIRCGYMDVGGITPLLKVAHLCQAFRIPLEVHMSGIGNLHVLATLPDPGYYERGLLHPFVDYEVPQPWLNRIIDPMDQEGYVHLPKLPGLGLDINFDYIQNNKI